jgi:tRNA pseudouridine32 synthase/23S rRNA pseudouridine746 synthase
VSCAETLATPLGFVPLPESPPGQVVYLYRGHCLLSGAELTLPRTRLAEQLALQVAAPLSWPEGKMLGVLLVRDRQGRLGYGKAYSGLLAGQAEIPGWVPPLHLPTPLPAEEATVRALEKWKQQLGLWAAARDAHPYPALQALWEERVEQLKRQHQQARLSRREARQLRSRPAQELEAESQQEGRERKKLRQAREAALAEPRAEYESLCQRIEHGRRSRRALSRALQAEMHQQLGSSVESLLGLPLERLYPAGLPTGSGDCCAPKLLAWAARAGLRPLALAELWWGGGTVGDKRPGHFYPACQARCQPLLGPLLSVALRASYKILYQDDSLLVVDKPGGLLTVPGRYRWNQDCLWQKLRQRWPELLPVHRLDLETSGVVVFARHSRAQANLRRQFEQRTVRKRYQALLVRRPSPPRGRVEAPLGPDPSNPGRYRIDPEGKSALTDYRLVSEERVELEPRTGRSHQLRVHTAQVLGCPIRGDGLYGNGGESLKLHAHTLQLRHPEDGRWLSFEAPPPF